MVRWWLALAIPLLSGCASPATPDPASGTTPTVESASDDPWNGQAKVLVAHQQWNADTFALDALCIFGGEWYVPRTGEPVLEQTASLLVTIRTGSLETGLQVGLQFQAEDILWLEPVTDGTRTFEVRVLPEQWERNDREAWTFWYRATAAGNPELCYTGVSLGARTISIEAVKG